MLCHAQKWVFNQNNESKIIVCIRIVTPILSRRRLIWWVLRVWQSTFFHGKRTDKRCYILAWIHIAHSNRFAYKWNKSAHTQTHTYTQYLMEFIRSKSTDLHNIFFSVPFFRSNKRLLVMIWDRYEGFKSGLLILP